MYLSIFNFQFSILNSQFSILNSFRLLIPKFCRFIAKCMSIWGKITTLRTAQEATDKNK